jgi:enterochelin esterase family protein
MRRRFDLTGLRQLEGICIALALALVPAPAAEAASTVLRGQHLASRLLGRDIDYDLYLPDGYAGDPGRRYPVLYLLPGSDSVPEDWLQHAHLQELADRMIAGGRVAPLIIVMPDAGNSWYVDNPDPGGVGPVATANLTELIPGIESRYRAQGRRDGRARAGLSMGGYGAVHLGFLRPDLFAAIASMSGALYLEGQTMTRESLDDLHGAFGRPFSRERFEAANVFRRIRAVAEAAQRPAIYLASGNADYYEYDVNTALFYVALHGAGIPATLHIAPGGHDWAFWTAELPRVLRFVSRAFAGEADTRDPVIDTPADDACPP